MKILLVPALIMLSLPAFATTHVVGPGETGFCTVSSRRESHLLRRSLVVCRFNGPDFTGDGVPEVIEEVLVLKPNGDVDCHSSSVATLDVTVDRHQAIAVSPACGE